MAKSSSTIIDENMAKALVPTRNNAAHKWSVGGTVIVAGSPSYPGAALLASRAAGRVGAGIVHLATGRGVIGTVASAIPEVAYIPLPETESSSGARKAADLIREQLEKSGSAVIGPGLGEDEASDNLLSSLFGFGGRIESVRGRMGFGSDETVSKSGDPAAPASIFSDNNVNVVIDADGLNWLARQGEWWKHVPAQRIVLTPHPGEMARLTDKSVDEIIADPVALATEFARKWQQTVVLKGETTVVTNGEVTRVADLVSPALATAGSGDVLAGTIGGLLAQSLPPVEASSLAVYLGPHAAVRLEDRLGVLGLIASDLPEALAAELAALGS